MSHLYWYTPDVFSCVSSFAYSTCRWGICTGSAYNSDLIVCSDNLNKKQTPFVVWLLMQSDIICMTELRKVIPVIIFCVNLRIKASAVWSFKSWRSGRWHLCNVKKMICYSVPFTRSHIHCWWRRERCFGWSQEDIFTVMRTECYGLIKANEKHLNSDINVISHKLIIHCHLTTS